MPNDIAPNTLLAWGMFITLIGTALTNLFASRKATREREDDRKDAAQTRQWLKEDRESEKNDRAVVAQKVEQVAAAARESGETVVAKLGEMGATLDTVHKLTNSAALAQIRLLSVADRNAADSKKALAVALRQVYLLERTEANKAAIDAADADATAADRIARESEESFRIKDEEARLISASAGKDKSLR